ncbi:MAG TPA: hypothetical protein VLC28_12680 [Flavitalea sp.]|nr:hypothetical protein [Flavitalea sp.]
MKNLLLLTIVACFLSFSGYSQSTGSSYTTAVGVKIYPGAITIKHFYKENVALEGLLSFWDHGFRFTGLYEFHGNIADIEGFKWYIGPGAHLGFYDNDYKNDHENDDVGVDLGIDGVLGVDYKIKGAPINLSLDWQPSFTIISDTEFRSWGGLGVRFTF